MVKILFICHGNICRSAAAEMVLRQMVEDRDDLPPVRIASAAATREEIGNDVYPPMKKVLRGAGYVCHPHAARQTTRADYTAWDYIIGMDEENMEDMLRIYGGDPNKKLSLLMDWAGKPGQEIDDPWYTRDFRGALRQIEAGCEGIMRMLVAHRANGREGVRVKNYIWDLDGTLIDSYGVIVSSLREVARLHDVEDSETEILYQVKTSAVSAYLRQLSDRTGADYDGLYQEYRQFSHDRDDEIELIPNAAEVLKSLRQQGAAHFVYTHRGASTMPLLKRLGLLDYFTEVVTWEAGFPPKPSGEGVRYLTEKYGLLPQETAYVGDRTIDVDCAKDVGVLAIFYHPEDSCVTPTGREDRVIGGLMELV